MTALRQPRAGRWQAQGRRRQTTQLRHGSVNLSLGTLSNSWEHGGGIVTRAAWNSARQDDWRPCLQQAMDITQHARSHWRLQLQPRIYCLLSSQRSFIQRRAASVPLRLRSLDRRLLLKPSADDCQRACRATGGAGQSAAESAAPTMGCAATEHPATPSGPPPQPRPPSHAEACPVGASAPRAA